MNMIRTSFLHLWQQILLTLSCPESVVVTDSSRSWEHLRDDNLLFSFQFLFLFKPTSEAVCFLKVFWWCDKLPIRKSCWESSLNPNSISLCKTVKKFLKIVFQVKKKLYCHVCIYFVWFVFLPRFFCLLLSLLFDNHNYIITSRQTHSISLSI